MSTFTATLDTARAAVRLDLDWADDFEVTAVTIVRIVGGVETPVRLPGPFDDATGAQLLSGGVLVVWDVEAPLDVPLLYEARSATTGSVLLATAARILNSNSDFETGVAPWTLNPPTGGTLVQSAVHAHGGTSSALFTGNATAVTMNTESELMPVTAGYPYRAGIWVLAPAGYGNVGVAVAWYDAAMALITAVSDTGAVPAGTWFRYTLNAVAPLGAEYARLRMVVGGTPGAATPIHLDDAEFVAQWPAALVVDPFTRVVAASWGAAPTGQAWVRDDAAPAGEHLVTGTVGRHVHNGVAVPHRSILTTADLADVDMAFSFALSANPLSSAAVAMAYARYVSQTNHYAVRAEVLEPQVTLEIRKRIAGVTTTLASIVVIGLLWVPGMTVRLRVQVIGTSIRAKAWDQTTDETNSWDVTVVDGSIPAGRVGIGTELKAGNSNPLPYSIDADNLTVLDLREAAEDLPLLPSDGSGWLKDPARPCSSVRIDLCTPTMVCPDDVPDGKVWFVGFDGPETYAADSASFDVVDDPLPETTWNQRKAPTGLLRVSTRTLSDRDRLLDVLAPGRPLLFQLPPVYGWPDRYLDIGPAAVTRMSRDHRWPFRRFGLPFAVTRMEVGPAQGMCGTRWMDLCGPYATWDAIDAAGLTGQDVLDGEAAA